MKIKTFLIILFLFGTMKMSFAHIGFGMFQLNPGKTFSLTHKRTLGYELSYKTAFKDYSRFHMSFNYTNLKPAYDTVYQIVTNNPSPSFYTNKLVYDKMKLIDINIGADFTPYKNKEINPYAGFQIGISNYEYTYQTLQEGNSYSLNRGITGTSALLKLGVGINIVFAENLFLDLDYKYHFDFYSDTEGYKNSSLGISMNWRFN